MKSVNSNNVNKKNMEPKIKLKEKQIQLATESLQRANQAKCPFCQGIDFIWEMDLNPTTPLIATGDGGMYRKCKPIIERTCTNCNKMMQFDAISLVGKENL